MRGFTLYSAVLSLLSGSTLAASSDAWKSRSIYFVLTDRFARSDSSTAACSDLSNYCGGTWQGMQSKLDYIKGMGFDAVWITPIVENTSGGYHGYWAKNIYNVNTNYGSPADLQALVAAAHAKGMYIMLDVVVNHFGPDDITTFTPFNSPNNYHPFCEISDWSNQTQVEVCRFTPYTLPDVKTEDPYVRQTYQSWITNIMTTYGFDGLRLDTAKHVEKSFYQPFLAAAGNPYAVGEVFDTSDITYDAAYETVMPGILNYPVWGAITGAYAAKGSLQNLVNTHDSISNSFPHPELLATFLDNHDQLRFLNVNPDWTSLKNALAYTLLARGIPILYGGTEQGYNGGADPKNREDLWRSGYATSGDLYNTIKKMIGAKKALGGLGDNDHVHLYQSSNAYVFSRANGNLIVITTNGGSGTSANLCFSTKTASGTLYSSVLGTNTYTVGNNGQICVPISNGQPEVLITNNTNPIAVATSSTLTPIVSTAEPMPLTTMITRVSSSVATACSNFVATVTKTVYA